MPSPTISGERRRKEQFGEEKNSITSLLSSNICMYVYAIHMSDMYYKK